MKKKIFAILLIFLFLTTILPVTYPARMYLARRPSPYLKNFLTMWNSFVKALDASCSPQRICVSKKISAYLNEDCSWDNIKVCKTYCNIDTGKCEDPKCKSGWICIDEYHKAYRKKDCTYSRQRFCKYGCKNGKCMRKGKKCKQRWKCIGRYAVKVGKNCKYDKAYYCVWGCSKGKCLWGTKLAVSKGMFPWSKKESEVDDFYEEEKYMPYSESTKYWWND